MARAIHEPPVISALQGFSGVLRFSVGFQFVLIFTFPEKVGTGRWYPFLNLPLHRIISYAHLGNIWSSFCQSRGPLVFLYYINNRRLRFLKRCQNFFDFCRCPFRLAVLVIHPLNGGKQKGVRLRCFKPCALQQAVGSGKYKGTCRLRLGGRFRE